MSLPLNTQAPDFSLPDQENQIHALADYAGRWLLIYFYPKDDTPGCTTEACSMRDSSAEFAAVGLSVLGVSADPVTKHAKFAAKYSLNFPLLSDPEHTMLEAYQVWGLKKFMGREYMGIHRVSYLISPEGKIVRIYDPVKPLGHAEQVLSDLKEIQVSQGPH